MVEDTALNAYHNHKRMTKYLVGAKERGGTCCTNSTQEVGEFFLRALLKEVPNLKQAAYLGDSAEAFANAARIVWPK